MDLYSYDEDLCYLSKDYVDFILDDYFSFMYLLNSCYSEDLIFPSNFVNYLFSLANLRDICLNDIINWRLDYGF